MCRLGPYSTVVVLLLAAGNLRASDISVNVPLEHDVYRFLERCEAQGLLPGLRDGTRPFSRLRVARALVQLDTPEGRSRLRTLERQRLGRFVGEFAEECRQLREPDGGSRPVPSDRYGASRQGMHGLIRGSQGELEADLLFRQQTDIFSGLGRNGAERIYRTALGGTVRGQVRGVLGFSSSFLQTVENGTRTYRTRDDVYATRLEIPQLKGNRAEYHEGKAAIVFGLPFARLEISKDDVAWGPGYDDNLGLSDNAPSFVMVRLSGDYGRFRFVSIHGDLRPCPARPDSPGCWGTVDSTRSYVVSGISRTLERQKYMAAHRVEIEVTRWLDAGFQEVVVYGDRGPELAYLNPVMFYWAAQSYLGDRDNLMMGVDVDVHPGNGMRVYAAYVVDDMKKLKVFSNDFANKFSAQLGLLWVDPVGIGDATLRMEYVRLEPWLFTHKFPINTFRHFDMPLGSALGPNSDQWSVRGDKYLSSTLQLSFFARRTRHGDNILRDDGTILNVGGDLHLGWRVGDERKHKSFLAGNKSQRTEAGVAGQWTPWSQLRIEGGVAYEWGDNVPLPPHWDPDTSVALRSRTGYGDGNQTHVHFSVHLGVF